jgi:diaminopimelate epimerase
MRIEKFEACGNSFVVVGGLDTENDGSLFARRLCHPGLGVGGDGLIIVLPSKVADLAMRIFNPDGSEAEVCGNGLRCVAKYVVEGKPSMVRKIKVETLSGIREVEPGVDRGRCSWARVDMGVPLFEGRTEIDLGKERLKLNLVALGNPHAVHFTSQSLAEFPLLDIGPKVENMTPGRLNFEVARVISEERIQARVWERGVGETLSCGSGACAVACAARASGLAKGKIGVEFRGGVLEVEWDGKGSAMLSGPVRKIFCGELNEDIE